MFHYWVDVLFHSVHIFVKVYVVFDSQIGLFDSKDSDCLLFHFIACFVKDSILYDSQQKIQFYYLLNILFWIVLVVLNMKSIWFYTIISIFLPSLLSSPGVKNGEGYFPPAEAYLSWWV